MDGYESSIPESINVLRWTIIIEQAEGKTLPVLYILYSIWYLIQGGSDGKVVTRENLFFEFYLQVRKNWPKFVT